MPDPERRHVCCCIDGAGAGSIVAEGRRLAGEDGRLSVVHVAPPEPVVAAALTEWGEADPADPFAAPAMWLEATVGEAGTGEPVLLSGDPPAEVACRWARENGVGLIVSQARAGGLRQRVLGSFAAGLAEAAPCPVLLVAAADRDQRPPAPPVGPYGHVAAVTDGSTESLIALDAAEAMATRGHSRVSVILLRSRWRRLRARLTGARDDAARSEIERRARELTGHGPTRRGGRSAAELERWARESGADLLVVAADAPLGPPLRRGAGGLAGDGECSVLVARAGA